MWPRGLQHIFDLVLDDENDNEWVKTWQIWLPGKGILFYSYEYFFFTAMDHGHGNVFKGATSFMPYLYPHGHCRITTFYSVS